MDNIQPQFIIDHLYQFKVIEQQEKEEINDPNVIETVRKSRLLDIMSRKSSAQFNRFLTALDESGQEFISEHLRGKFRLVSMRVTRTNSQSALIFEIQMSL
jgi:hypothetical protein